MSECVANGCAIVDHVPVDPGGEDATLLAEVQRGQVELDDTSSFLDHSLQLFSIIPAIAVDVHFADERKPRRLVERPGRRVDDVIDANRVDGGCPF